MLSDFHGKMKAVTFSYDDMLTQDQRLIRILEKYNLKCTFNLNSGNFGKAGSLVREDVTVAWCHPRACEIRAIYDGHEIAAHTVTHPNLSSLKDEDVIREVEQDRQTLSEVAGYEVVGMAYPCGTDCVTRHVAELIREHTGIRYARTTTSTYSFDQQDDLLWFNPTVYHHQDFDRMFELADRFIQMKPDKPQLFYIWGHTFEFDIHQDWERFEEFCRIISGHPDIFYGTNREVLLP